MVLKNHSYSNQDKLTKPLDQSYLGSDASYNTWAGNGSVYHKCKPKLSQHAWTKIQPVTWSHNFHSKISKVTQLADFWINALIQKYVRKLVSSQIKRKNVKHWTYYAGSTAGGGIRTICVSCSSNFCWPIGWPLGRPRPSVFHTTSIPVCSNHITIIKVSVCHPKKTIKKYNNPVRS